MTRRGLAEEPVDLLERRTLVAGDGLEVHAAEGDRNRPEGGVVRTHVPDVRTPTGRAAARDSASRFARTPEHAVLDEPGDPGIVVAELDTQDLVVVRARLGRSPADFDR